jgi:hypothetical protein
VLLAILENYYTQRELDYLRGNAQVISGTLRGVYTERSERAQR